MKEFLLQVVSLMFLARSVVVKGYVNNPSIQWDPRNPIFERNVSKAVLPMSKITIVCPNPALIPTTLKGSIPKEQLFENFWIVDKSSYDSCVINTPNRQNRVLMQCNNPLQLKYFTIVFNQYSAEADGLEFVPGKEYYFMATSTGNMASLTHTSGGRCVTHNMRIVFYVCRDANDPRCLESPTTSQPPVTKTVTVSPSPTSSIQVTSTTMQPSCSAAPDNHQMNEILNNTRLLPVIFNHTSQLTNLWAQLHQMNTKLDAVQSKLENCSLGQGNGHLTPTSATPTPTTPTPAPVYDDCTALYAAGFKVSGVYNITVGDGNGSFPVYCDQTTAGGGWTVIQKRFDGSVIFFNKTWLAYQNGFGDVSGEYWLGLDKIYRLAKNPVTLRFDLGAPDGTNKYAVYSGFTIKGADEKYKLTSGRYSAGNAGNSFSFENGGFFSTVDQDNDKWGQSCAITFNSAWWHTSCHKGSLNGLYLNGSDTDPAHYASGITWHSWKGYKYFLTKSEMKIKP